MLFYASSGLLKFTCVVDSFSQETRLAHCNFCLQKWTYFLVLDAQVIVLRTLIQVVSFLSRYTPPWSHDHKYSSLAVAAFAECFYTKAQEGVLPPFLPTVNRLILYLQCHTVGFLPCSQKVCNRILPPAMSHCVMGTDPLCGGYSVHQDGFWTNHFGHLTFAGFCGSSILHHLEPHAISDLVIAASGTWRSYQSINPFYPHLIMIDFVGGHGGRWHTVSGCDIVPVDSPLDWTVHSGCNTLYCVVSSLCYSIPGWEICGSKPQVNSPNICKSPELPAAEGRVIICKEFVWWATFKKHCLPLVNHTCRVLSY